jgi:polysaccharide export outer membrane protein
MKRMFSLVALCWLAGCAASPPPVPTTPTDDAAFATSAIEEPVGLDDDAPSDADLLHAGDLLSVRYLGSKDIEPPNVVIDRTGRVHLPLVGDVVVAGSTPTEAEQSIELRLRHFDKFSTIGITVMETKGRVATVTGAVEHPGNVPLVGDARLADVLAFVGGPKTSVMTDRLVPLGDIDGTRVMRNGKALPIDAARALEGAPRHNIRIRAGDVIMVPPSLDGRIVVLGLVNKPQTLSFRRGMRLTEVLADSGGLSSKADSQDVRILRGGYAHPRLYVANVKDLLAGRRSDVVLAPGDVVYVTEHWFASVGDVLERLIPAAATGLLFATVVK